MDRINETKGESRFFLCQLFIVVKRPPPNTEIITTSHLFSLTFLLPVMQIKALHLVVGRRKGDEAGNIQ
jgi:hypothetical protein